MEHCPVVSTRDLDNYKSNTYKDTVLIGLDNLPPIYDVKRKLEGNGGSNLKFINNQTGGIATLKGHCGVEPLTISIEHNTLDGLRRTRRLVINLVKSVYEDLQQSCPAKVKHLLCLPPHLDDSSLNSPSPPLDQQAVHGSSSESEQEKWNAWRDNTVKQVNQSTNIADITKKFWPQAHMNKRIRKRNKRRQRRGLAEIQADAKKQQQKDIQQNMNYTPGQTASQPDGTKWLPLSQGYQNYTNLIAKERLQVAQQQPFTFTQSASMVNEVLPMTKGHELQLPQSSLSDVLNHLKQRLRHPTPQQSVTPGLMQPKPQQSVAHGSFQPTSMHMQTLPQHNQSCSGEITKVLQRLQQVACLLQRSEENTSELLHSNKRMSDCYQFIPEQGPNARGNQIKEAAQKKKEEQIKMLFGKTISSNVMKTEQVICRAKHMLVWLMPENGESLYSALACCLFGPFRSSLELNEMAASLHSCAVRYIRKNRGLFCKDLENLYSSMFPDHKLDPCFVYEHCCLYLMKPNHKGEENCIRAIARMFGIPIVVHYEDGRELTRYDPVPLSSLQPISVVRRIRTQGYHFDLDRTPELASPSTVRLSKPIPGPQLIHVGRKLYLATWDVGDCSNKEVQNIVDEALSVKDIDLACIQGTLPPQTSQGQALTSHYKWWFKVHTDKPSQSIAILVNNNCEGTVSNFVSQSESLATIDFNYNKTNFAMIGCHLPDFNNVKYNKVSAEVINALNRVPSFYQTILLGQFHAQIGTLDIKKQDRHLIGYHLYHYNSNINGIFLKELAINRNLRIVSTTTNDKGSPITYCSNKDSQENENSPSFKEEKSQISYILIKNWVNILEVQKFSWWEACSDHAIVGCRIALVPYSPSTSTKIQ